MRKQYNYIFTSFFFCLFVLYSTSVYALTFNFKDADLRDVIEGYALMVGKSFIIDSRVTGKVNVISSEEISIDQALYTLGQYEDQNNSLVSSVDKMKRMRLTIDFESLKVSYGEYIKGLEMSKVELMNLEPPFKYFDQPTYPLDKEEGSIFKSGVYGSLITGFLLAMFSISRVEFAKIMAE